MPPDTAGWSRATLRGGPQKRPPALARKFLGEFARPEPVRPAASEDLDALTEREREVLDLVVQGHSNAEIARELVIAQTTVKTHLGHVLDKLGLRDRVHAVVYGYEYGLITPGGAAGADGQVLT